MSNRLTGDTFFVQLHRHQKSTQNLKNRKSHKNTKKQTERPVTNFDMLVSATRKKSRCSLPFVVTPNLKLKVLDNLLESAGVVCLPGNGRGWVDGSSQQLGTAHHWMSQAMLSIKVIFIGWRFLAVQGSLREADTLKIIVWKIIPKWNSWCCHRSEVWSTDRNPPDEVPKLWAVSRNCPWTHPSLAASLGVRVPDGVRTFLRARRLVAEERQTLQMNIVKNLRWSVS